MYPIESSSMTSQVLCQKNYVQVTTASMNLPSILDTISWPLPEAGRKQELYPVRKDNRK